MFTLRQAIFDRLKEIAEERRALADERRQLLDRLQLLEQQTSGIDAASVIHTMNETVQALSDLVPQVPATVVIQEIARKVEESGIKIEPINPTEATPTETETVQAVQEAAHEAKLTKPTPKKRNYSAKEVGQIICSYIRENGGIAANKNIEQYLLEEHGVQYKDFSQALWTIRKVTPKLLKGKQGFSRVEMEEQLQAI